MQSFILQPGGPVVWKDKRAFPIVYMAEVALLRLLLSL